MASTIAFYVLAGLILTAACWVVAARNLFHAGIGLITCFLGVAGIYVLLGAHFIAGLQVLIYAGAVAVILLFAFMLTQHLMNPDVRTLFTQPTAALITALGTAGVLIVVLHATPWATAPDRAANPSDIGRLGQELLTTYLFPFELVSLFLLAALVGAIVIARKEEGPRT